MRLRIYILILIINFSSCKFTHTSGPHSIPLVTELKNQKKVGDSNTTQTKIQTLPIGINNENIEKKENPIPTDKEEEKKKEGITEENIYPSNNKKNDTYYSYLKTGACNLYNLGASAINNMSKLSKGALISTAAASIMNNSYLARLSSSL